MDSRIGSCGSASSGRSAYLKGGQVHTVDFSDAVRRLGQALDFARSAREVRRDDGARELWHAVYPKLSEGQPGLVGAVLSRAEAQVMRLAMIYALLDQSSLILVEHLTAALVVWDYCEASARYCFGDALGDPVADEILRVLRVNPDGQTRTEIWQHFQRHKSKQRIDAALAMLEDYKLARMETEDTGGRPSERWFATDRECAINAISPK